MSQAADIAAVPPRLLIVGNPEDHHVGAHFRRAAESLGLDVALGDIRQAYGKRSFWRYALWRLDRRPVHLGRFSRRIAARCKSVRPAILLATGLAPVRARELRRIAAQGTRTLNFLTDDPWNPVHAASWFFRALACYDAVYSPRRALLDELRAHGCRAVHYLPFAYSPEVHFPAATASDFAEAPGVLFIGAADNDRLPFIRALVQAGIEVRLYGGDWGDHADMRPHWRGNADLETIRRITPAAGVVLGLVRRANRDGHAMRSFEGPAMRGCMMLEDTPEHRAIFGPDGEAVLYFGSIDELISRTRWLLERPDDRRRLAESAHVLVTGGRHRYADRLQLMLELLRPVDENKPPEAVARG